MRKEFCDCCGNEKEVERFTAPVSKRIYKLCNECIKNNTYNCVVDQLYFNKVITCEDADALE